MLIAICDDDSLELARISTALEVYRQQRNLLLTYKTYSSATELVSGNQVLKYDLLFLDILMPGLSGIEAAKELRSLGNKTKIIFLTSSPEFALESYSVNARDYILKPVSTERLFSALDAILAEEQLSSDALKLKTGTGMLRILFSKIIYVEVMSKHLWFHLADGSVREVNAPLSAYEDILLARPEFIKVHRSYLVNLWHMEELTKSGFITDLGKHIPISRLAYSDVRKAYMEHLFEEKEVEN